jgi:hypothetical protein
MGRKELAGFGQFNQFGLKVLELARFFGADKNKYCIIVL